MKLRCACCGVENETPDEFWPTRPSGVIQVLSQGCPACRPQDGPFGWSYQNDSGRVVAPLTVAPAATMTFLPPPGSRDGQSFLRTNDRVAVQITGGVILAAVLVDQVEGVACPSCHGSIWVYDLLSSNTRGEACGRCQMLSVSATTIAAGTA